MGRSNGLGFWRVLNWGLYREDRTFPRHALKAEAKEEILAETVITPTCHVCGSDSHVDAPYFDTDVFSPEAFGVEVPFTTSTGDESVFPSKRST
jgi:hypothetical protein